MKLEPCPFCGKPIPKRMTACPYCHRDEKGMPIVMDTQVPADAIVIPKLRDQDLVDIASDDPYIRQQTIIRLTQMGPAITLALTAILSENKKPGLAGIAKTLGHIADRRAIPALAQAAKQGEESLHLAAIWALAQFRDAETLPVLLAEAERAHPVTQSYIANVLGTFQDPSVVPVLSRLALHGSLETMYQAAYALGEWHEPEGIQALKRLLRRRDPLLRAAAMASLKRLGVHYVLFSNQTLALITIGILLLGGGLFWFYK